MIDQCHPCDDLLYWAAISKAINDILSSKMEPRSSAAQSLVQYTEMQRNTNTDQSNSIICLVFGAGLGRLVQFCIDAIKDRADYHHLSKATIYAVDANPLAVDCLTNYFSDYQPAANSSQGGVLSVIIYPNPFSLFPGMQKANLPHGLVELYRNCDLIVSELLGCFGCDEFLPELTSTLCNLFLRSDTSVCIPKCWQSYIVPIQSYALYNDSLLSDKASSTYTVGVPGDCIFMSEPKILWKGSCYDYQTPCNLEGVKFPYSPFMVKDSHTVAKWLSLKNDSDNTAPSSDHLFVIHGIIGYFTSYLYDDIYIDTRHCSRERNSFHWECFYMPIEQPLSLPIQGTPTLINVSSAVCVSVNRICAIIKPANSDTGICGGSSSAGIRNDTRLSLRYSWKIEHLCNGRQEEHIVNRSWETGNAIFLSC